MTTQLNSLNLTTSLLTNLHAGYPFLPYVLRLLTHLLRSGEYLRSLKSLLEFRKVVEVVGESEDE